MDFYPPRTNNICIPQSLSLSLFLLRSPVHPRYPAAFKKSSRLVTRKFSVCSLARVPLRLVFLDDEFETRSGGGGTFASPELSREKARLVSLEITTPNHPESRLIRRS